MNTELFASQAPHRLGETATPPIDLRWGTLAALLLLAGISPQRRRALPELPITAHSGVFNYHI